MTLFYRRLPRFNYLAPKSIEEALLLLAGHKGKARLLAGGTDLVPQLKRRETAIPEYVIDLKGIAELKKIVYDEAKGLTIGALATITAIEQSADVRRHFPILTEAALLMASPQVRNRGTFVGNICNAAASADSAPSLLVLHAAVQIKGPNGDRTLPLTEFFTGPGTTALQADEIVTAIHLPEQPPGSRGVYLKLSPRHSMDLAVVGVAALGACENGVCNEIRIGLGAVAPTPIRATGAEAVLAGRSVTPELIDRAAQSAMDECSPRKDSHRASPQYRRDMVYVMTRRAINQVLVQ
jgi:carbon-monoxide dehydrogenase medium subunit